MTDDKPQVEVRHKGLLVVVAMAAMTMQVLDSTIANVALPHIRSSLGASQDTVSWVLTSYIVASAVATPAGGSLANRFGVRNVLLVSVLLFVVTSVLCGIATSLPEIVAFRILQGVGGALLAPLTQTIMLDINKPSDHPRAMAIYGTGVMVGPITGPIIGGWLTEYLNWRWVFLVNLPIGVLCFAGLWFLMPKVPGKPRQFDFTGWALIGCAVAALQLLLDRGHVVDWFDATEIWVEAVVAICAFWMFLVHQATAERPLFPRALIADRNLMVSALCMFVLGALLFSVSALMPGFTQGLMGYSVIGAGWLLAMRGTGVMLSSPLAGRLCAMLDPRIVLASGFAIMIVSLWMMTGWTLEMDWRPIVLVSLIQGFGMGLVFVPLNLLAFATLDPALRADGAGLFNLFRNLGASVGISIVIALLATNTQISHADIAASITADRLGFDPGLLEGTGETAAALAILDALVYQQATMIAYLDDYWLLMICCSIALPLLVLLRQPADRPAYPVGGTADRRPDDCEDPAAAEAAQGRQGAGSAHRGRNVQERRAP